MKTIGILGGVGPQTTSDIYLSLIDLVRKSGADKYPPIIVYNLPFPFIIENEAIIEGKNSEKMIPYLIEGAKILEKAGADFGILPCNTLHKYIEEIRESVSIPFLSIIEETILALGSKKQTVGILATETTIRSKIYEDALKEAGIDILYPSREEQSIINNIIVELLKGVKSESQTRKIEEICFSLQNKGAKNVLLACTDLQMIPNIDSPIPIIDTTEILIKASLREIHN